MAHASVRGNRTCNSYFSIEEVTSRPGPGYHRPMQILTRFFSRLCERFLPDALGFCLLLTFLVYFLALIFTPHAPLKLVAFWGDGLWNLNAFAFQMITVLVTGHMLATSPLIKKLLDQLADWPGSSGSALILLSLISLCACWMNWGFGLIVSAVMAMKLARRFPQTSVGVFLATGYAGFVVWHAGLSGSIPLSIAGADKVLVALNQPAVSITETLFSLMNLSMVAAIMIAFPMLAYFLRTIPGATLPPESAPTQETTSRITHFREWTELSRIPLFILGLMSTTFLVQKWLAKPTPDINDVNLIFFTLCCFLLKNISTLLNSLREAVKSVGGVIIQYPLYAGIMGLMQLSGLGDILSQQFVQWSSPELFPVLSFLSAGLLNFFVPSGGGQWVVQGPILIKAGLELGVPVSKTAMAIAWGDAWTNLVQPFWTLPMLAIAGLKLQDIMGACVSYLLVSGVIIGLGFFLF